MGAVLHVGLGRVQQRIVEQWLLAIKFIEQRRVLRVAFGHVQQQRILLSRIVFQQRVLCLAFEFVQQRGLSCLIRHHVLLSTASIALRAACAAR